METSNNKLPGKKDLEIFELIVNCHTNQEMAQRLKVSKGTIDLRLAQMFEKYNAKCKTRLGYLAGLNGWVLPNQSKPDNDVNSDQP